MQTLNLDEDIYFLLLLGMVAVGAHAYTLFNQRSDSAETSQRWRFLSNVPIQLVTKKSNFNFGFTIYLLLFELIYLVLASSSSLVLMMYQISGRDDLTGALSANVNPNGAVPILASTAIILLSQVRPFSSLELALRGLAHRFARIPDGLKTVKQNIVRYLQSHPLCYLSTGDARIARTPLDNGALPRPGKDAYLEESVENWINSEFNEGEAKAFVKSYWNTLCLNEYTLETIGNSVWDADESEEILRLFGSTEHEVSQLRSEVESAAHKYRESLASPVPAEATSSAGSATDARRGQSSGGTAKAQVDQSGVPQAGIVHWKSHKKKCLELEERLILLLSLLIINQPDVQEPDHLQLNKLINAAHENQTSQNTRHTLTAALFGSLMLIVLFFVYYILESELKGMVRQDPFTGKAPFGEHLESRIVQDAGQAELYSWSGLDPIERRLAIDNHLDFFRKISIALSKSINECILILLIFISSVGFALGNRTHHVKLRDWSWKVDSEKKRLYFPVNRYYLSCTYAAICSLAVLFTYYFLVLALLPAFKENKDVLSLDLIEPFIVFMPALLLTAFVAWVCAYFALYTTDLFEYRALEKREQDENRNSVMTNSRESGGQATSHVPPKSPFIEGARIWLFFGICCALVALTRDLYLMKLGSRWELWSTVFINFVGFSVLFYFFIHSLRTSGYVPSQLPVIIRLDNHQGHGYENPGAPPSGPPAGDPSANYRQNQPASRQHEESTESVPA